MLTLGILIANALTPPNMNTSVLTFLILSSIRPASIDTLGSLHLCTYSSVLHNYYTQLYFSLKSTMALTLPTKAFRYEPLEHSARSIRLLKVEAEIVSDLHPIRCHLETFELDDCPPYIALSYTWGDPEPCHDILLNNISFSVRENLYAALVALSTPLSPQPLGPKSLCDILEHSLEQLCTGAIGFDSATNPLREALDPEQWNAVLSCLKLLDGWKTGSWKESDLQRIRSAVWSATTKHEYDPSWYEDDRTPNPRVSPLLYSALKRPYYWIDAICINQDDPSERGHQVNMMGSIYSQAACVFTWLGLASEELDRALKSINKKEYLGEPGRTKYIINGVRDELETNPYWTRMWIVQEFTLARAIIVLCGCNRIEWAKLEESWALRYAVRLDSRQFADPVEALIDVRNRWHVRLTSGFLDADTSLDMLIVMFGSRQCSNVRDRVYALLSMVRHQPNASKLYPDYNITPKQLYLRVLGHVRHTPSLSDTVAWKRFRTSLRAALEIPLDPDYRMIELLYDVTEPDRSHRKPLLHHHPDHRIQFNHDMLGSLASFFEKPFDNETWDPQQRYTEVTKLFEDFPKEEDPQAWETFDHALKDALGLGFTSDMGDAELWETFIDYP